MRTIIIKHPLHGIFELGRIGNAFAAPTVSFAQLHEIRVVGQQRFAVSLVVEQALPLMNHAQRRIVHEKNLHVDALDGSSCHFLNVHLERAIARNAYNLFIGTSNLGTDSSPGSRIP